MHDHGGADGDARGAGHADEARIQLLCLRLGQRIDVAGRLRVRDDCRELRRQRNEKSFVVLVEFPPFALTYDEDAQHATPMNDGNAKKRVERFFAHFLQVQETGMPRRVVEIDGLGALGHQPDQTFLRSDRDAAHSIRVRSVAGGELKLAGTSVEDVDRTELGRHGGAHAVDDRVQRCPETRCRIDVLDDFAEIIEYAVAHGWSTTVSDGANSRSARR